MSYCKARNIKKIFFVFEIQSGIFLQVWLAQKIVLIQGIFTKPTGAQEPQAPKNICDLFGVCSLVYVSRTVFKENIKHFCFKILFQDLV